MKRSTALRVGICGCTPRYHGKIAGRTVSVGGKTFRVEEIRIPEDRTSETLRRNRCHFFLDLHHHLGVQRSSTYLDMNDRRRREGFPYGGITFILSQRGDNVAYVARTWDRVRSPCPAEIMQEIACLLRTLDRRTLRAWLGRMALPRRKSRTRA